jgi:CRP-like cAMP-binding protein
MVDVDIPIVYPAGQDNPRIMAAKDDYPKIAEQLATRSIMFRYSDADDLKVLASKFTKMTHSRDEKLIRQGEPQTKMLYLADGEFERLRMEKDGVEKVIGQFGDEQTKRTAGALHFLRQDPAYATLKCVSASCTSYALETAEFRKQLATNPKLSENVIYALQKEVRSASKIIARTPLLRQGTGKTVRQAQTSQAPILATSFAASVESFYRSALNAYINSHLTGAKVAKLFPDMHVQVPIRVLYINGTKGVRTLLNKYVNPDDYKYPNAVGLGILLAPGLTMTPVSSVLEAANAGHKNPEPLTKRWARGLQFRAVREIIFAIGLNQMSDYLEERVPAGIESGLARNMIGSLTAGVMAGYFSHVPHNLSTLKLMEPHRSYGELFKEYAKANESRMPKGWSPANKELGARVLGIVMPKAVATRTVQIIGTFVLLNGIIYTLKDHVPF